MLEITSPQNPRVKHAIRLRHHDERERAGQFLIDGRRELERALLAGIELETLFVCIEPANSDRRLPSRHESSDRSHDSAADAAGNIVDSLVARSRQAGAEVLQVAPRVFEKLTFGDRHEGIVAVAHTPRPTLANLQLSDEPLVAVLEGCEKPGNLGAVLRGADGTGVEALIAADLRTDLYNPNAIRASLGTLFTVPTIAATTAATLEWLRQQRMRIFAARLESACPYTEVDLRGRTAIVLGSEAHGLSPQWNSPEVIGIRLPMLGAADSLNVSATAAVLFYEALRQRQNRP